MVKALPKRFNPDLLARDGTQFKLVIPQNQMTRLRTILSSDQHDIHFSAMFSRRKDNIFVSGRFKTEFSLECQRCLKPMSMQIDEAYELVFVDDEERAEALPKQFDPVILDEQGQIHVVDLFEDELMLHVPDIPKHVDMAVCTIDKTEFGVVPVDLPESAANPFEALKDLKLH